MAKLHNLILWQSHRSGYWICEIHDHTGLKGIGLGHTKELATTRASSIAGVAIPASRMPRPCNSPADTSVSVQG